jgi:hypothetical protein
MISRMGVGVPSLSGDVARSGGKGVSWVTGGDAVVGKVWLRRSVGVDAGAAQADNTARDAITDIHRCRYLIGPDRASCIVPCLVQAIYFSLQSRAMIPVPPFSRLSAHLVLGLGRQEGSAFG